MRYSDLLLLGVGIYAFSRLRSHDSSPSPTPPEWTPYVPPVEGTVPSDFQKDVQRALDQAQEAANKFVPENMIPVVTTTPNTGLSSTLGEVIETVVTFIPETIELAYTTSPTGNYQTDLAIGRSQGWVPETPADLGSTPRITIPASAGLTGLPGQILAGDRLVADTSTRIPESALNELLGAYKQQISDGRLWSGTTFQQYVYGNTLAQTSSGQWKLPTITGITWKW